MLDRTTASLAGFPGRRSGDVRVLRQGLAYCWSVAVAALPEEGRAALDRWIEMHDPAVRWVMRQNLGTRRLRVLGADWIAERRARLDRRPSGRARPVVDPPPGPVRPGPSAPIRARAPSR